MNLRDKMRARLPHVDGRRPYIIRNADGDGDSPAVIRIYEEIGLWGVTAEDIARDLEAVTADTIEVQIASPGGDVFDGLAMFNALRAHPAQIVTRVDGIAASAASVIAQAGDQRIMLESSQMMIHDAWGLAIGPADEMRDFADLLDRQSNEIAAIYANRAGGDLTAEAARDLMRAETWLSAAEAVELGLADEIKVPERKTKTAADAAVTISADMLTDEVLDRLAEQIGARLPSAGEREDITDPDGDEVDLSESVDPEQASRLLDSLTFTKETPAS